MPKTAKKLKGWILDVVLPMDLLFLDDFQQIYYEKSLFYRLPTYKIGIF